LQFITRRLFLCNGVRSHHHVDFTDLHHTISLTLAAAALLSVIGGPDSDFNASGPADAFWPL
jgi:hypothetical protein